MKDYTLMLVGDERSPVRRFHIPAEISQRLVAGAIVVALLGVIGFWDYWRLRADNGELDALRIETAEQREQLRIFERTVEEVETRLSHVKDLERKVRIIANLPGAVASGGEQVTELAPPMPVGVDPNGDEIGQPVGVQVQPTIDDLGEEPHAAAEPETLPEGPSGHETERARHVRTLDIHAQRLGNRAQQRSVSLEELVGQLEKKSNKLASSPSIWPTRGWLTSRYGYRVSPFTGRRHLHSGIDIAARPGTPIVAPAKGKVKFVGRKGPLGKTVILDHGYGVRTIYGHNSEITVATGEEVERGQKIAAVGSTGRSTGPHLHYTVQVDGKSRDPLNYIFD